MSNPVNATTRWPRTVNARQRREFEEREEPVPEVQPDPADIPAEVAPLKRHIQEAEARVDKLDEENEQLRRERDEAIAKLGSTIRASPAAMELAKAEKVALADVKGTGADGAITKSDVQGYISRRA